jgi:PhnB protein
MRRIIPDIAVENCKDALEYYRAVFGGEIKNTKTADGNEMFKGHEGKVMHSELHINDNCIIYFSDIFGQKAHGSDVKLLLQMDSLAEIEKVYSELKNNGNVFYELQKSFWGAYHAVLTDKYGVTWELSYTE